MLSKETKELKKLVKHCERISKALDSIGKTADELVKEIRKLNELKIAEKTSSINS